MVLDSDGPLVLRLQCSVLSLNAQKLKLLFRRGSIKRRLRPVHSFVPSQLQSARDVWRTGCRAVSNIHFRSFACGRKYVMGSVVQLHWFLWLLLCFGLWRGTGHMGRCFSSLVFYVLFGRWSVAWEQLIVSLKEEDPCSQLDRISGCALIWRVDANMPACIFVFCFTQHLLTSPGATVDRCCVNNFDVV